MATFIRGVPGILEEIDNQRKRAETNRLVAENSRKGKRPTPRELRLEGEVAALRSLAYYLREATIMSEVEYDRMMASVTARSQPAFARREAQ